MAELTFDTNFIFSILKLNQSSDLLKLLRTKTGNQNLGYRFLLPSFLFQSIGFSWFLFRHSFEPNFFYILTVFYEKVIADDWSSWVDEID